jgi:hypothetical protein
MNTQSTAQLASLHAFKPVAIGTSPSGVEWIAHKPENVEPMRLRLAVLKARHADRTVRRVKLTPTQFELVLDVLDNRPEGDQLERVNLRRTFIEARGEDLVDIASLLEPSQIAEFAECGSMRAQTDAELAFVWRSAYAGALLLVARLNGGSMTLKSARKAAKFERAW